MHTSPTGYEQPRARRPRETGGILLLPPSRPLPEAVLVTETASQLPPGQRPAELAHDARNLVSALNIFSELLACPGVLAPGFGHYADDLRRVAASGARLIEALAAPKSSRTFRAPSFPRHPFPVIDDLGEELSALERPLRALAGPGVRFEIECAPCAGRLALNSEDLLRILFNLVANSVEALAATPANRHRRPCLRITAQQGGGASFLAPAFNLDRVSPTVVLSVRDNGPGIAAEDLPHIFDPGFSTRAAEIEAPSADQSEDPSEDRGAEAVSARGMGLSIVRQLVEAAGGAVRAVSPPGLGARLDIELPVLTAPAAPRIEFVTPGRRIRAVISRNKSAQTEKEA